MKDTLLAPRGDIGKCTTHPRYVGKAEPKYSCWACWIIRLRKTGWVVHSKKYPDSEIKRIIEDLEYLGYIERATMP